EADDILARLADECEKAGANCFLVTGDKDCRQLISDRVKIYNVRKDLVYGANELEKDWGIRPEQVVDFQGLVGDKTDGIPGVDLIGPKTARELLDAHGSLEAVLEAAPDMKKGKRRDNLVSGRDVALLSRDLATLVRDTPVDIPWERGEMVGLDGPRVREMFQEFGFRGFGQRVDGLTGAAKAEPWTADYRVVDTLDELDHLVANLKQQSRISIDTETTDVNPRSAELVGLSLAYESGEAYYIPVAGPAGDTVLDRGEVIDCLRPILEDTGVEKIGQNLKYDVVVLRAAGVEMRGVAFDSMIASYLLDAGERNHSLDDLSQRYLRHKPISIKELIGTGRTQKRMDEVSVDLAGYYAAEDADIPLRLREPLNAELETEGLSQLYRDVEVPLVEVLAELEYNGIRVDPERLAEMSAEFGARIDALEQEIYKLAGHEFNIASPKQLATVLFDELDLPVTKKTKSGPSTDASVLEHLAELHELPKKIIEYRQFAKLKGTYVDALPKLIYPKTGRVHASFNQVVAATGRLSSSDPNLQNIPIRTETGRAIRSAFLPGENDWKLLAADYSQIELRVLAHYCQDEELCRAFAADEDIHRLVASQVQGVVMEDVTADMRRQAKAVNFGVIYGQSPFGLAKALGIEQEEAAEFIDTYFARYPQVDDFLEQVLDDCLADGSVRTILGRRRKIDGIRSGERRQLVGRQRTLPERTAINTVIQGSAADLIKLAMLAIHRRLRESTLQTKMLLQIHDELIFEVPPDEMKEVGQLVIKEMSGVMQLEVPLKVDVKIGDNWAECE
ncbi:MAG: DNA polymerase I, partial [Pirellulales bacterium]|nr:DNA polymerase I [Pirellulales bacterium]